jgi:hypothetical protein
VRSASQSGPPLFALTVRELRATRVSAQEYPV